MPAKPQPTKDFYLRLPPPLHAKLRALAKKENRSMNNLIVTLLMNATK
jgi:predicted HicB family RNase H-like nuclease